MSYSINVSGHKSGLESVEDTAAFEEATIAKVAEFVASLEGVSSATGTFGNRGYVNFLTEDDVKPAVEDDGA